MHSLYWGGGGGVVLRISLSEFLFLLVGNIRIIIKTIWQRISLFETFDNSQEDQLDEEGKGHEKVIVKEISNRNEAL